MYQALYRKYRPQTLNDVSGQDTIVKIISNSIKNNKISHAYLFAGPRGTGKTSIAKIFAHMVNCENLQNNCPCGKCVSCTQINNSDIIEIDAASNNGVDEIRELRNKVNLVPSYGKYKVYIIDEVHMLTTGAFNALLKTLEEPPAHIIFILATTDPHKIPETILSRCQRLDFKKISENNIVEKLTVIAQKEQISIDQSALREIARLSDGGLRDSIGMLDQAVAYASDTITAQDIHDINGTLTPEDLKNLLELITEANLEEIFKKLDFYNDGGKNFVKLTEEIITFMRNILLYKEAPKYFKQIYSNLELYSDIALKINNNILLTYINILNNTVSEMKTTTNTKLLLELALIKMVNNQEKAKQPIKSEAKIEKTLEQPQNNIPKTVEKLEAQPVKENLVSKEKDISKNIDQPNPKTKDKQQLQKIAEIKNIRINNTLARFKKSQIPILSKKILILNDYLLDPDVSKWAAILLDGQLKAASEQNLIFVYQNERLANLFNENLVAIEATLTKVMDKPYKAIATDINDWENIKNIFNSKKKTYTYEEEQFNLADIFSPKETNEFSNFEDIIEYN